MTNIRVTRAIVKPLPGDKHGLSAQAGPNECLQPSCKETNALIAPANMMASSWSLWGAGVHTYSSIFDPRFVQVCLLRWIVVFRHYSFSVRKILPSFFIFSDFSFEGFRKKMGQLWSKQVLSAEHWRASVCRNLQLSCSSEAYAGSQQHSLNSKGHFRADWLHPRIQLGRVQNNSILFFSFQTLLW